MKYISIAIISKDQAKAESLKIMIERIGYVVYGIFVSPIEFIRGKSYLPLDLFIIDAQLDDEMNGIDAAIEINQSQSYPIIFITNGMDDYLKKKAIFKANAASFIGNQPTSTELITAIDFAISNIKKKHFSVDHIPPFIKDSLFVRDGSGFRKILISDILFLKAEGSYCLLTYLNDTQEIDSIIFSDNLGFMEEKLSFAEGLRRIHRSYIVNIRHIRRIHEQRCWIGEFEIPISKSYASSLFDMFRFI